MNLIISRRHFRMPLLHVFLNPSDICFLNFTPFNGHRNGQIIQLAPDKIITNTYNTFSLEILYIFRYNL